MQHRELWLRTCKVLVAYSSPLFLRFFYHCLYNFNLQNTDKKQCTHLAILSFIVVLSDTNLTFLLYVIQLFFPHFMRGVNNSTLSRIWSDIHFLFLEYFVENHAYLFSIFTWECCETHCFKDRCNFIIPQCRIFIFISAVFEEKNRGIAIDPSSSCTNFDNFKFLLNSKYKEKSTYQEP